MKYQVRAHVANRISSFRGGANVEEEAMVGERQGCERDQIGDLVQAGHHGGNLGVSRGAQNQDEDILGGGQSDQGGGLMGEQVNSGKSKATGLEDIRAKTLTQVEVDSDIKNNLHIPQTSVGEHFPHGAGSNIICVQPATSS